MPPVYSHNSVVNLANRFAVFAMKIGIAPKYQYILSVVGRKSGRVYSTPVYLVEENENKWLVSPYGEVAWVKNARADRKVVLTNKNRTIKYRILELSATESAPVLRKYLGLAPITQPYFDARPDSDIKDFEKEAARHPVFQLNQMN